MLIRIATRRSRLALAQANWVAEQLRAAHAGLEVELREYVTRGDVVQDVALNKVGSKGVFTREIEQALLAGEADLAVHSMKDLPSEMPEGLRLAAVPVREDPRDVLVLPASHPAAGARDAWSLIPPGARVGTGSVRRQAQLLARGLPLTCELIRGNVETRLRKLDAGEYQALVLAAAGLKRLDLEQRISAFFEVDTFIPAPGQGVLAVQSRTGDAASLAVAAVLNNEIAAACSGAERNLMGLLGGGCSIPLAAYARADEKNFRLAALVASPDGSRTISTHAGAGNPEELVRQVHTDLLSRGAAELLAQFRTEQA